MLRWYVILRGLGARQSLAQTLRILWISMLFGTFLPAGLASDTLRMWIMRQAGAALPDSINSVLIDRIVGLIGMVAIAERLCCFAGTILPAEHLSYVVPPLVGGAVTGIVVLCSLDSLPSRWPLAPHFARFARDLRRFLASPISVGSAGAATLFCAVSQPVIVYLIGRSLGVGLFAARLFCARAAHCPAVNLANLNFGMGCS